MLFQSFCVRNIKDKSGVFKGTFTFKKCACITNIQSNVRNVETTQLKSNKPYLRKQKLPSIAQKSI